MVRKHDASEADGRRCEDHQVMHITPFGKPQNENKEGNNMLTDIVGSHLAPEAFAGQNGDPEASSLLPGAQPRRSSVAKKIMKGTEVSATAGDWQTRNVSAAPIKASPTMHSPAKATDKVPLSTNRGSIAQHMARQGHAKRR
jgi:hypothetical protein